MINVYDKEPGYRTSFRAADFYSLLSAYDETASRNLGISQNNHDDIKRTSVFQAKCKIPKKNKDEMVYFSRETNNHDYCKAKTFQPLVMNTDAKECTKPNPIIFSDLSQQYRMKFSSSLPQALEKLNSDTQNPKKWNDSPVSSSSNINRNFSKVSGKNQTSKMENSQNTRRPSIVVKQVDVKAEIMTMELPNCRGLPTIPKAPRILRTRVFFNQIKAGLKEHIEWHTTQLQQAELDQDTVSASKASENVNQLQHRLNTILCLEHEYMKHWKLFKEIRSRSQGELYGELTNIGGTCGMEGGYNGLQSSVTDSLSSLSKNKLSKSTLALTGFDESDYNQPLRFTSCVNSPHYNNRQYFHENFDTTSYLPKILEKRPKYSSLMNLIRHKSKKSTNNCSVQNDNRPRAITTIDHKLSSTQLDKQSNFDLTKTSMKVTTLCNNNNSYYSKGLSKSKSNARECIPTDFSLKQQQEILIKRLCQIEAQTEYLSGTLICEVIGISGSTASLSRDVFKISLKYGSPNLSSVYELQTNDEPPDIKPLFTSTIPLNQKTGFDDKWTVTGRLSSSSFSIATSALSSYSSKSPTHLQTYCLDDRDLKFPAQKWDHTKHIFNPTIGDVLTIKAVMLKRFGKPEVFIQQACDIVNLLTYKGHHISVGLKHFTDLQFHFILKWCPLADTKDDRMLFYNLSAAQLATFMDEHKQKESSIRFILNDQEISESSSKDECHRIRRLNTDSFSHKADHRYNNQHHLSNLLRTEACSSDFIVPQDDPDSSDLENKGSITILTVRSNRANPSRRYVPNKYVPKISKWISLPDLEITHEASDSEIKSHVVKVITVRTQPDTGIKNGHQNNGINTATNTTNVINTKNNNYNYPASKQHKDDDHIYISEKDTAKKENRTKDRSQEGSLIDNNFVPVKIGLLQTSRPPELASKSTNGQLSDKINKLKDKVDAKRRIHGDQSGLLKDLDKALTNLITQLEKNSNQFTELLMTEQPQSYTSLSASPKKADFSGTFEGNTDKQNTLKSLWESLAYLDEIEKSNTEDIEDQETSSISSSLHSLGINEDTGIKNHKNDQDIRTSGWKQFDLALIWHLNYTLLLLDRVYPDHLFVNSSISVSEATDLHISQNTIDNNVYTGSLNTVRNSIHSAWSALALSEQIEFFMEAETLCQSLICDLQSAKSDYLLKVIGDGRPYSTLRFTCFLSKLIWPVESSNYASKCEDMSSPQIIFDRNAFRETLLQFFEKDVVPRWSKDMGNGVIDHFIDDVLDVEVNGSDLSTVPLTHLNLRLKLSERMRCITMSSRSSDENSREQLKQFNVYFIQLLSYLAGQLHIQWNLENAYSSRTLSTLPYFTRALQPIFGLNLLFGDACVDPSQLDQRQNGLDMRSTELAACHSTQTWLKVAELIGSYDEEINKKATLLLKSMNDKINEIFRRLTDSKQISRLNESQANGDETNDGGIHQIHDQSNHTYSKDLIRRPIFYLMGPPIHIQYCLHKKGIQQNLNSLSPIWTSMIWGLEQKSNAKRIVALKALNVLLESDIRGKVKNTLNTNNRTREQYENSFNRVKSSALLKLLRNMRSNDPDPAIKEIFGQIIDKITTQFKSESYNEQVDKPSRLLKTIWTKLSSAENLPSKPSHISRSQ